MNEEKEGEAGSRQNRDGQPDRGDASLCPDARGQERRQADESMRRVEERCALAQRNAGVGTWE